MIVLVLRLASAHKPKVTVIANMGQTVAPIATISFAGSMIPLNKALPMIVTATNMNIARNPKINKLNKKVTVIAIWIYMDIWYIWIINREKK